MPGLAPSLAATVPSLVESCRAAVASLPVGDRVLLVTSGPRLRDDGVSVHRPTLVHLPGTPISSAPLTGRSLPNPFESRLPGAPSADDGGDPSTSDGPGVGIIVGAALLAAAGIQVPTTAVEVGTAVGGTGPQVESLLTAAGDVERVVLLVIAEGSAARDSDFPADGPDAAQDLDRTLARALAAGDPAALAHGRPDGAAGRRCVDVHRWSGLCLACSAHRARPAESSRVAVRLRAPGRRVSRGELAVGVSANRLVVVAGPTGTGKSDLALDLAERLGGEIVNADSMQLYRGMDIGTAKVPPAQRRGIPHHLLDVLDIRERASVAAYQAAARRQIETVLARGGTPLLVGGSGLYINSVIDDIEFPGTDPAVRAALESELADGGPEPLFARLLALDPAAAAVIEPANGRRLVRALEVMVVTGRPFSATLPVPGPPRYDALLVCLDRETTSLDVRLDQRVRTMIAAGFLDEVTRLDAAGLRDGVTASRALGYPQMLSVLDGLTELDVAVAETVRRTRRFVRRQRSWFGRDSRMRRLDAGAPDVAAELAALARGTAGPARSETTAQ